MKTRVWMVPAAGGEAVAMTADERSASHPRWSPDNRFLAFLAAPKDGEDQVWTLFREGGEAVRLTDTAQGVSDFEWSPDGRRMVLVLQDPTPVQLAVKAGEKKPENPPPVGHHPPPVQGGLRRLSRQPPDPPLCSRFEDEKPDPDHVGGL